MSEELLLAFAKEYFHKIDNMPLEQWGRLSIRVKAEHLERMEKILDIATPIIEKQEREKIRVWGNERCLEHHTSMNNVAHRWCNECWQALKGGNHDR